MTARDHESAVNKIGRLKERLVGGSSLSEKGSILLLSSGISLLKKYVITQDENLHSTSLLLFVCLCLSDSHTNRNRHSCESTLEKITSLSIWHAMSAGENVSPADATKNALAEGVNLLSVALTLGEIAPTADCFFTFSNELIVASHLASHEKNDDFLTLGAMDLQQALSTDNDTNGTITTVINAAESEAGQSVLRDIMLSFLLPRNLLELRRTLLLPRSAAYKATVAYPELVQRSHEAAMSGAEWLYENAYSGEEDELRRICALLAGVACLTTKHEEDAIRKGDAFGGLVQLPFLCTAPPPPGSTMVSLVPSTNKWVLFKIDKKGKPDIKSSVSGIEGLRLALIGLIKSIKI